eukprot:g12114.t1
MSSPSGRFCKGWKRRQSHSGLEEVPEAPRPAPPPAEAGLPSELKWFTEGREASPQSEEQGHEAEPPKDEAPPALVAEVKFSDPEPAVVPVPAAPVLAAPVPAAPAVLAPPVPPAKLVPASPESPAAPEPTAWAKLQETARCRLASTREAAGQVQLKAQALAQDPHVRSSALGATAGAALGTAGGAATGLTTGTLLGAAVGVIPAVFTFGLSIPFCAAVGGGAGLAVGAASGATCGAVAGGATGYGAYRHRHEIRQTAHKTLEQVTTSADFVKARANGVTHFLSERALVAKARLMGGPRTTWQRTRSGAESKKTPMDLAYTGGFLHFLYKFYSPTVRAISAYLPSALSLPLSRSESMAHCFACAWVDNIHCGSFYIPVYFLSVGLMQSDSLQASKENLMAEWWTTYVTCTGFWVPFMCANWRFCPAAHRVKAMQTANLFWNVIIDHLAHREEVHEHAHHEEYVFAAVFLASGFARRGGVVGGRNGLPEMLHTKVPSSYTWLERWGLQSFVPEGQSSLAYWRLRFVALQSLCLILLATSVRCVGRAEQVGDRNAPRDLQASALLRRAIWLARVGAVVLATFVSLSKENSFVGLAILLWLILLALSGYTASPHLAGWDGTRGHGWVWWILFFLSAATAILRLLWQVLATEPFLALGLSRNLLDMGGYLLLAGSSALQASFAEDTSFGGEKEAWRLWSGTKLGPKRFARSCVDEKATSFRISMAFGCSIGWMVVGESRFLQVIRRAIIG